MSAFGVGGTNAHVIVEEAPPAARIPTARSHQLLVLSAKTPGALDAATLGLATHLEEHPELELADVAHTLQLGRRAFAERRVVVAGSLAEAVTALRSAPLTRACQRRNPPVVALFGPEDAAPVNVGRELYERVKAFRDALLQCVEAAEGPGRPMVDALYPTAGREEAAAHALREQGLGPLATFAVEFALARLWESWGLRFETMAGDGVGALVAACLGGTTDLPAAVRLAVQRGRADAGAEAMATPGARDAAAAWRSLPADADRLCLELGCGPVTLRSEPGTRPALAAPRQSVATYAEVLRVLGQLWLAGVEVDWPALHAPERRRRVPLPTYRFERERFWVEPIEDPPPPPKERTPAEWLYRSVWKNALPAGGGAAGRQERTLVFLDSSGVGLRIAERLRDGGSEVVTVSVGRDFAGDPASGYTLDPREARHYVSLWGDLQARQMAPRRVLHFWGLEPLDEAAPGQERFQRASDLGFYSLLHLVTARPEGPLALKVIASGLHEVIGGEALAPEKAPVIPLCRVLVQEHHDLSCELLDVDAPADGPDRLVEALLAELWSEDAEPVVAYRRGRRWLQDFEMIPLTVQERSSARVRTGGVYLITGGLGDVGVAMGLFLAHHAKAKLVLTGRSEFLPRERWAEWLKTHADETAVRIKKVLTLEAVGAEVLVLKADASSSDEMRAAVLAAHDRFGALHGVIHAAGELAPDTFRPVEDLGRETCERQFGPKVLGLVALEDALRGQTLDFCLLTSSISSILGGVGYAAYAGANAFMDAFAARQHQKGERAWVSVDWDQWAFEGRIPSGPAQKAKRDGAVLRADEGVVAFERILRLRDLDRVVVSRGPLDARLARWVRLSAPEPATDAATGSVRPRPPLSTAYAAPGTEQERVLAGIWQELLGIEKIGIHDNFFELGGHSLFAARVLSRVRSALGVSLPLEAVFEAPTIAELAGRVAAVAWSEPRPPGTEATGERVEIEI